jgi:hypothetical protein
MLVGTPEDEYAHSVRKRWLLLMTLLALFGGAGWGFRVAITAWWRGLTGDTTTGDTQVFKPDPATYSDLIQEAERWRKDLSSRHAQARSEEDQLAAEHDARVILELLLPAMMRCWLGTPWDFSGTAAEPGGGKIACGYFVATVLKDAGFRVDRFKLAKQPSENILRSFLPKESCILTIGSQYEEFASNMEKVSTGIYLIGLDTHVGFLVIDEKGFRMVHSSGSSPWCVVDETRDKAHVLRKSNWRMIGNLTLDRQVIRRWLRAEKIQVRGA